MKRTLLLILSVLSLSVAAQDYYWVGNSGNWSDPSHWATSSGGSEFHAEPPSAGNDVYVDENSFTLPNQELTIDQQNVYCGAFNTTGVLNSPTISMTAYNYALRVHGDLILTDGVLRDLSLIFMSAEEDGTTVTTGETYLGPNSFLGFGGEEYASYELLDSVSVNQLGVSRGELHTNGQPIHCTYSFQSNYGPPRAMYFEDSKVYLNTLDVNSNMELYAEEATFYFENTASNPAEFNGGGFEYGYAEFSGEYEFTDDNTFSEMHILSGSNLTLEEGSIQTAQQFYIAGTSEEPISIFSSEAGQQASLQQTSGMVDGNYLTLRDNAAIGGATFTADNSLDLGNNSGWNIIEDLPANYYWVGGTGNWSDLNHWATSSGGSETHSGLPTPQDTVIIDENSFSDAGTLNINTVANMADFRMENVFSGVTIDADESIHVFGDILASGDVIAEFQDVYLDGAPGPNYITSNGMYWGPQSTLIMEAGGVYFINDDLFLQALNIDGGAVVASNITIEMDWQIRVQAVGSPWLDLSGSTVYCDFWRPFDPDPNSYNLEGATFYCDSQFGGGGLSYDDVFLSGDVNLSGGASFEYLELEPGLELTIDPGTTYEVDEMSAQGTATEPITIDTFEDGEEAYFEGNMMDVNANYLELKDNHAIGSATFIANNSTIGSNVEGWQIPETVQELAEPIISYPNPVHDQLYVELDTPQVMTLIDSQGRIVLRKQFLAQGTQQISLKDLAPGYYILKSENQNLKPLRILKQ